MTDLISPDYHLALYALWVSRQVVAGLLIADFVSGVLHWMQDRYGGPKWPIVGPLVRATIRHHKKPRRMITRSFMQRNAPTFFISALFLAAFAALGWINVMTLTGVIVGAFANEFHNWSHRKPSENGPVITWFQNKGLIIAPLEHARHHRDGKNSHFCAVTGWMNAPLERVRFWRRLEALIRVFAKERPRRDPTVRRRPVFA